MQQLRDRSGGYLPPLRRLGRTRKSLRGRRDECLLADGRLRYARKGLGAGSGEECRAGGGLVRRRQSLSDGANERLLTDRRLRGRVERLGRHANERLRPYGGLCNGRQHLRGRPRKHFGANGRLSQTGQRLCCVSCD